MLYYVIIKICDYLSCPGGLVEGTCQVLDPGLGIRRVGVSSPGEEAGGREVQMASVRASA